MSRWLVYLDDEETRKWSEVDRPSVGEVMDDRVIAREVAMVASCLNIIFCGAMEIHYVLLWGMKVIARNSVPGLRGSTIPTEGENPTVQLIQHAWSL
jgi:hypothetical protein